MQEVNESVLEDLKLVVKIFLGFFEKKNCAKINKNPSKGVSMRASFLLITLALALSSCVTDKATKTVANAETPPVFGSVRTGSDPSITSAVEQMIVSCNVEDREGFIKYEGTENSPLREQPTLSDRCSEALGMFNKALRNIEDPSGRISDAVMIMFATCDNADFDGLVSYFNAEPGPERQQPSLSYRCNIGVKHYNHALGRLRMTEL